VNILDTKSRAGQRIRELRDALGLTQEQLALATGYERKYVSEVERGVIWPQPYWMISLGEVYGITSDYILRNDFSSLPRELQAALLKHRKEQQKGPARKAKRRPKDGA
jgi:transcriptional regulator with XRE-family HTH domain